MEVALGGWGCLFCGSLHSLAIEKCDNCGTLYGQNEPPKRKAETMGGGDGKSGNKKKKKGGVRN